MHKTSLQATLCGLTALTLMAAPGARAQTPPATPAPVAATAPKPAAATATTTPAPAAKGPLIAGVCLLSQESLIARSKVGQAATARLRELSQQVQANINAEKARLEARGKALEAKRATLPPVQFEPQAQALNQRMQALQAEAGERSQQMDATKTRAYNQVLQQAQPFITEAYATHACGLLFARETLLTGNMGNDLTPEVIAALDAKATPISFDLAPPPAK
jgi:Skp family chaperone for outer membrane proteins